jgi:phosphate transport system permease protein
MDLHRRPNPADAMFRWASQAAAGVVLVVLAGLTSTMVVRALPAFEAMGLGFVARDHWAPAEPAFGALAFVWGTAVSSALAVLLAVPVSLGIALYATQVATPAIRRAVVALTDLLAVVPSVVFGLWGVLVLSQWVVPVFDQVRRAAQGIPVLERILGEPSPTGRSFATAGLVLALMITPIVASIAREVIDTTPASERDAALALGATRWEAIRAVVLPHAAVGMVGAVMLGLGRALGETIAASLVIGSAPQVTANLFAAGDSLPAVIVNQWGEADDLHKSALVGLAVVLLALTFAVNSGATLVVSRSVQRARGAT